MDSTMIGQLITHYKVLEKLGEGGMGVVYKAHDLDLERVVALKFLPQRATAGSPEKERFVQEAKSAAALNHPNICTVFGIERHDDAQFIVMEYVDGKTLAEMETSRMKTDVLLSYAIQIAEALQEAHSKGIVHRDIKADNIMVNTKNQVKVMDFGLAKLKGSLKLTRTSSTVGTIAYMAPEQIQGGAVDARSDIFAFGVLLHQMFTGNMPFRGAHDAAMMYSIVNEEPEPLEQSRSDLPPELGHVIRRALEKNPDDRFQSMADVLIELRRARKDTGTVSRAALPPVPRRRSSGRALKIGGIISAAVVLVAAVIIFLRPHGTTEDRKSIAVVPFVNLSDNKADEYFADGMTEDIIIQLSKIHELQVISRTSVMQFKNSGKTSKEIGSALNVATVLEGTVRREGNEIRVDAQLIDTKTDQNLWAEAYDNQATQVFAIQRDVAQKIATALKATLSPEEQEQIEKKPTTNLTAYDYYLKGREYYYRYRKDENDRAVGLFQEALKADQGYALAYAGLGDCYGQRVIKFGYPQRWLDSSIVVCTRALQIDPTLAEAHKALALAYSGKGWSKQALDENLKSVEYNPNNNPAIGNVSFSYLAMGDFPNALRWGQKSIASSPSFAFNYFDEGLVYMLLDEDTRAAESFQKALSLQPDFIYASYGSALMFLAEGAYDQAEREAQKIVATDPNDPSGLLMTGNALLYSGDLAKAEAPFKKAYSINPQVELEYFGGRPSTALGYIYLRTSRTTAGRTMLEESVRFDERQLAAKNETFTIPLDLASVRAIEGNKAEALRWLGVSIKNGWRFYRLIERSPYFRDLGDDSGFQKLLVQMKSSVEAMRNQIGQ